jgi:hypothetical protein
VGVIVPIICRVHSPAPDAPGIEAGCPELHILDFTHDLPVSANDYRLSAACVRPALG